MDKSPELCEVLRELEVPEVEQSDPVDDGKCISYIVELHTKLPTDSPLANAIFGSDRPKVYLSFEHEQHDQASARPDWLKALFQEEVRKVIRKERDTWRAQTFHDRAWWRFDESHQRWEKDPNLVEA